MIPGNNSNQVDFRQTMNPNNIVITPEMIAQLRNAQQVLGDQGVFFPPPHPSVHVVPQFQPAVQLPNSGLPPNVNQQLAQFAAQNQMRQQFLQNGNNQQLAQLQQQFMQHQQQHSIRHHQAHAHNIAVNRQQQQQQRQAEKRRGSLPNADIEETPITVTFTTYAGTTSATMPSSYRMAPFSQTPQISALFLEAVMQQYQLMNPFHCHRIEVPGVDGGLVYYNPTALLSILNGVLDQVQAMSQATIQITNSSPNALPNKKKVATNLDFVKIQAAHYQKKVDEQKRQKEMVQQHVPITTPMVHNGYSQEQLVAYNNGKAITPIVPEAKPMDVRNEDMVRHMAMAAAATAPAQQSMKRPTIEDTEEQKAMSKRARDDVVKQLELLQSELEKYSSNICPPNRVNVMEAADEMRALVDAISDGGFPYVSEYPALSNILDNVGKHPASIAALNLTGRYVSSSSEFSPASADEEDDKLKIVVSDSDSPKMMSIVPGGLTNLPTHKIMVTDASEILDQGQVKIAVMSKKRKRELAVAFKNISSEEKDATEVLLGLHKSVTPPKSLQVPTRPASQGNPTPEHQSLVHDLPVGGVLASPTHFNLLHNQGN